MKRGFTILELLVASILLGMVTTIVTMLINQSSVSWRVGSAMVSKLDNVRDNAAELRDEADNAFVHDSTLYRFISPWSRDGKLRKRACDASGFEADGEQGADKNHPNILRMSASGLIMAREPWTEGNNLLNVGNVGSTDNGRNYTVNVMSGGPKNDIMDWRAIWSFPDDFD